MKIDHEKSLQLATRIYELDAKVYKSSGSELGRTLSVTVSGPLRILLF